MYVGSRSVGDAWPEPLSLEESLARRRRRRQPEPPLLALRLGPLCVPLVSPSPPPPESEPLAIQQLLPPAGPADEAAPCPAVARLRCLVASREPGLEQRLAAAGEAADAAFYARWLKARGGCPEAATAGILAHVAWREELVRGAQADAAAAASGGPAADAAGSHSCRAAASRGVGVPEAAIQDELAARKVFLQGCDAQGCPVVVVKAARWGMRALQLGGGAACDSCWLLVLAAAAAPPPTPGPLPCRLPGPELVRGQLFPNGTKQQKEVALPGCCAHTPPGPPPYRPR
jgi:hypothetical protein